MSSSLSSSVFTRLKRPICPQCLQRAPSSHQQIRNATLIKRPRRPYTFTQLVTLSDGSAYLQRTTSPAPVYKSNKDIRNTALWNPSSQKLLNVEDDEAGRLAAFRAKFGRGWDAETIAVDQSEAAREGEETLSDDGRGDSLLDLITTFSQQPSSKRKAKVMEPEEPTKAGGKSKGGKK